MIGLRNAIHLLIIVNEVKNEANVLLLACIIKKLILATIATKFHRWSTLLPITIVLVQPLT